MAINATTAGFTNTGHDLAITLANADGTTIPITTNLMQFDSKQETQDITRVRLDNSVLVADLPKLWTGTLQFDRGDAGVDAAISQIEESWFSGFDYKLGILQIFISTLAGADFTGANPVEAEVRGSTAAAHAGNSTITFLDVSLKFDDAGTWRGDDATTCRLSFRAARRKVDGVGAGTFSTANG